MSYIELPTALADIDKALQGLGGDRPQDEYIWVTGGTADRIALLPSIEIVWNLLNKHATKTKVRLENGDIIDCDAAWLRSGNLDAEHPHKGAFIDLSTGILGDGLETHDHRPVGGCVIVPQSAIDPSVKRLQKCKFDTNERNSKQACYTAKELVDIALSPRKKCGRPEKRGLATAIYAELFPNERSLKDLYRNTILIRLNRVMEERHGETISMTLLDQIRKNHKNPSQK